MTRLDPHIHLAMLRVDFTTFVARAMSELEAGTHYDENWHIVLLAHELEQVRLGETRRLMINMPPRSLKTLVTSVCFPAFLLGHDPSRKIMCISYSTDLARDQANLFHRIVTSDWYRRTFPAMRPAQYNKRLDWATDQGGYRLASSIMGGLMGRGADCIIIDDPNKGQEIHSQAAREKVKRAYDHTISTRLNQPRESAIICVMQRLHEDDLAGHLAEQEEWRKIVMPAIATQDEHWDMGNGMSYSREAGEALHPARMGLAEYALKRRQMGATMYEAQYQQSPLPRDGQVIKRSWLRYYDTLPEDFEFILVSWDTASTLSENADFSVGTVWGLSRGRIYLLHVERDRLEAPDLRRRIEEIEARFSADQTIVENADLGRAIVQDLRRSSASCMPIAIPVRIDKIARMEARAVMFETGKVLLPREAAWLMVYEAELLGFPSARHDDQVDSTSQALDFLQRRFAHHIFPEAQERVTARPTGADRPKGASFKRRI